MQKHSRSAFFLLPSRFCLPRGLCPAAVVAALGLGLFALAPNGLAQTIRITSWNLQPLPVSRTNNAAAHPIINRIQAAATELKRLDPDVILLQQVNSWWMCEQLARALKPAKYNVLTCSAFRDARSGALRRPQVAILAKEKGYFAWSEAWRSSEETPVLGGFAFAALQIGKERIGVFSVQAPTVAGAARKRQSAASREALLSEALEQLLVEVGSVSNWQANRVESLVVGGTLGPAGHARARAQISPFRLLEVAGFDDAFRDLPAAERATMPGKAGHPGPTVDYILIQSLGSATNPRILPVADSAHYPLTCELTPGPAGVVAAPKDRSKSGSIGRPPRTSSLAGAPAAQSHERAAPIPPHAQSPGREPQPAATQEKVAAPAQLSTLNLQHRWLAAAAGATVAIAVLAWIVIRRRRALVPKPPALLTAGTDIPTSYTVVVSKPSDTQAASAETPTPKVPPSVVHIELPETHTEAEVLRQRALAAEQRAERANAVVRDGLIPQLGQWLKQKLVRKLIDDRASLLETQQAAAHKALAVEVRLARIEQQIQRQNASYQARIEELTRELIVAKEENRELIRARIAQVKAEMEAARAKLVAESEAEEQGG
jgi:hypothetical protein